jgi:hypothetical protein
LVTSAGCDIVVEVRSLVTTSTWNGHGKVRRLLIPPWDINDKGTDDGRPLLEREIDGHTNIKNENPLPELFNYILSCSCAMVLFLGSRAGMLALVGTIAVVIIIIMMVQ